jgi:hypothetical protein
MFEKYWTGNTVALPPRERGWGEGENDRKRSFHRFTLSPGPSPLKGEGSIGRCEHVDSGDCPVEALASHDDTMMNVLASTIFRPGRA